MDTLLLQTISVASSQQRKGRTARTCHGVYYPLFTQEEYSRFRQYGVPEIQRVELLGFVLQALRLGFTLDGDGPSAFPYLDEPGI